MSKRLRFLLAGIIVLILLIAGGLWWFFRDDAPDEVALGDAVDAASATVVATTADPVTVTVDDTATTVAESAASAAPTTATTVAADGAGGVDGEWTIDPDFGEFDYESATGSFVGFRIEEELQAIGSTTAVGRTGDVTGTITIDGTTLTAANFEVDLTTITTNESRRDDRVQSALDTGEFPTATFTLTEPVDLGAAAATGGPVAVTVAGDLTIHGVTQAITMDIEAELVSATGRIALIGSSPITFADYGVEVPSAPVVLSAEDHGILELQFILERA